MTEPTEVNRECGVRHRFSVTARSLVPSYHAESMERLLHWCRVFDAEGLAPVLGGASAGNLSFRTARGYVITPTRTLLKATMDWRDLVEVVREDLEGFVLHTLGGRAPSSDAFLHGRIYARRPDVAAVFHGHDDVVLTHADALAADPAVAVTREAQDFGTRRDAEETAAELGSRDYVIRRGHGFVAVGRTLDLAGALAVRMHRRAAAVAAGR